MHVKAGSFQGFTPILSAAQLCKHVRKVLTDIANGNVSPVCILALLARRGRQNLREQPLHGQMTRVGTRACALSCASWDLPIFTCVSCPLAGKTKAPLLPNGLRDLSCLKW